MEKNTLEIIKSIIDEDLKDGKIEDLIEIKKYINMNINRNTIIIFNNKKIIKYLTTDIREILPPKLYTIINSLYNTYNFIDNIYLFEVAKLSKEEMLNLNKVGEKKINEFEKIINENGIFFGMNISSDDEKKLRKIATDKYNPIDCFEKYELKKILK